jgi:hypothetical protein
MLLEVRREASANGCTLGSLYVDGVFECFTLEDVVREVPGLTVVQWKIPAETAIPSGTYKLIVTMSARFHKFLPELVDVPGFAGVRIHCGNCAEDTEGCILVGRQRGTAAVLESRAAFNVLFPKIKAAFDHGEAMQIRVVNPRLTLPVDPISRT